MPQINPSFTPDVDLQLKDAGLIAADDICQVDSADQILDIGAGLFWGKVVIDASAVEVASGDESYEIVTEFSSSATFASTIVRGPALTLGDASAAVFVNADTDNGVGVYELPFVNRLAGTVYRYMRLSVNVTGTIATGVNFEAWVAKL